MCRGIVGVVAMVVATVMIPSVGLATAQGRTVYRAADLDLCDPRTPTGSNARAEFLFAGADRGVVVQPPWQILASKVEADRSSIGALLDLARCYSTFYRGIAPREGAIKTREVLQQVRALLPRGQQVRAIASTTPSQPGPTRLRVGVDVPPTPKVKDRKPVYPPEAQRAHRIGMVFVDAIIDAKGKVSRADVVGSVKELDGAARDAVRRWEYQPTMVDGKAVEVVRLLTVKFDPDTSFTVTDGIDIARFHYATGSYAEVGKALEYAATLNESIVSSDAEKTASVSLDAFRASLRRVGAPGMVSPTVVKTVQPTYTEAAMRAKIQGDVTMRIVINADGSVGDVAILKSLDTLHGLDAEAVATVMEWRFTPATDAGRKVPVVAEVVMSFKLH